MVLQLITEWSLSPKARLAQVEDLIEITVLAICPKLVQGMRTVGRFNRVRVSREHQQKPYIYFISALSVLSILCESSGLIMGLHSLNQDTLYMCRYAGRRNSPTVADDENDEKNQQ